MFEEERFSLLNEFPKRIQNDTAVDSGSRLALRGDRRRSPTSPSMDSSVHVSHYFIDFLQRGF